MSCDQFQPIPQRNGLWAERVGNIPTPYKWHSAPLISSKHFYFLVDLLSANRQHPLLYRYAHEITVSNILSVCLFAFQLGSIKIWLSSSSVLPIVGTTCRKLGLTFQEVSP